MKNNDKTYMVSPEICKIDSIVLLLPPVVASDTTQHTQHGKTQHIYTLRPRRFPIDQAGRTGADVTAAAGIARNLTKPDTIFIPYRCLKEPLRRILPSTTLQTMVQRKSREHLLQAHTRFCT